VVPEHLHDIRFAVCEGDLHHALTTKQLVYNAKYKISAESPGATGALEADAGGGPSAYRQISTLLWHFPWRSWMPEEFQIEGCEDQDNANVHH
jgi:hypothetical protein